MNRRRNRKYLRFLYGVMARGWNWKAPPSRENQQRTMNNIQQFITRRHFLYNGVASTMTGLDSDLMSWWTAMCFFSRDVSLKDFPQDEQTWGLMLSWILWIHSQYAKIVWQLPRECTIQIFWRMPCCNWDEYTCVEILLDEFWDGPWDLLSSCRISCSQGLCSRISLYWCHECVHVSFYCWNRWSSSCILEMNRRTSFFSWKLRVLAALREMESVQRDYPLRGALSISWVSRTDLHSLPTDMWLESLQKPLDWIFQGLPISAMNSESRDQFECWMTAHSCSICR